MLVLNNKKNFNRCSKINKKYYHINRWKYTASILNFLSKFKIDAALELGSYLFPYYQDSDLMDKIQWPLLKPIKFLQSAQEIPWNIPDKTYDIFIATNVWEHLEGNQRDVFSEVKRTSKSALLSFPYKWKQHKDKSHIGIDMNVIKNWCLDLDPDVSFKSWTLMICYWEFNK